VCGSTLLLSLQKVFERGAVSSGGTEDVAREQGRLGSVRPVAGGFVGCSEQDAAGRPLETDEARSFGDLLRAHSRKPGREESGLQLPSSKTVSSYPKP